MTREQALEFVSYAVDDARSERSISAIPAHARLIGWQCGYAPLFVAVWSYLPDVHLDEEEAEEIATDLLIEKHWFSDEPQPADHIL